MADKGTANQRNCCHPQSQHTTHGGVTKYRTKTVSNVKEKKKGKKKKKKALIELWALRPTAMIDCGSESREARPVDVPHVAGIIKGNLCHPPIFPRPFTLIPLPSPLQAAYHHLQPPHLHF